MATLVEHAGSKEQKTLKLELTRVIKASRQRVFDAWTRPDFIRQWFGSEKMPTLNVEADSRVGGTYRIEMGSAEKEGVVNGMDMSRTSAVSGRYIKVEPHDLLVFTWRGDWNPTEETLVTVALRDVEGGTEIKLTQERFATEASRDQHRQGWAEPLVKLAALAESK